MSAAWNAVTETFYAVACVLKLSETDMAVKMLIGTLDLAVGVTVTAMTGGAVLPVEGTVLGGTLVGGAFSGAAYAVSNVKNGEWNTEDYLVAVTYGLADGYMWSGVTAGAEAVYGWYKTGRSTAKYVGEEYYTGSSTSVEQKNTYDSAWDLQNGSSKNSILARNRVNGKNFEHQEFAKFSANNSNAVEQITVKTPSGVRTRVDAIGLDANGKVVISEFKSSATAPLTKNQKIAFPEIMDSGGIVVGKGKGIFKGGYQIPSGTKVRIVRPK